MKHSNDNNDVKPLYIRREAIEKLIIYNIDAKEAINAGKVPESNISVVKKIVATNNMLVSKFIEQVIFSSELN
ncbi:hypothetical protein [Nostoc phage N1]|nr:hypothetical protein [Nostoc phage N1]